MMFLSLFSWFIATISVAKLLHPNVDTYGFKKTVWLTVQTLLFIVLANWLYNGFSIYTIVFLFFVVTYGVDRYGK